ncbi:hypothetical protein DEM27_00245 [Metarhizobium album]|uniref:Uncharacterized protein n=2 Tax=Metarhizobium album TaxID=2182425 RepID=A0A2U2DWT3_9HYPH|nr:hypothetical protein DEM27_00245 [Rhizobium album]
MPALVVIFVATAPAHADPQYKLNKSQTEVVALSRLTSGGMCQPGRMRGQVVARTFDPSGVVLMNFAVEEKNGDRTVINVDTDAIAQANRVTQAWVMQGLHRMIREGKQVSLRAQFCGAAGRVVMLDGISTR